MRLFVVLVAAVFCTPMLSSASDEIDVPGGTESVSRLLGYVSAEPTEFAASVNRVLLSHLVRGQRWEDHDTRVLLVEYLQTVQQLKTLVGERLEIPTADKAGRKRFEGLAKEFGFQVKRRKGRLEVIPIEGREEGVKRRVAVALGWDFVAAAQALSGGSPAVFELSHDRAESPVPFELWNSLSQRPVNARNALSELAMDQDMGFFVEGLRRLNHETAELVRTRLASFVYNETPEPFFRYSSSLELIGGALTIPGGPGAIGMWREIVGVSPEDPEGFIRGLLAERGSVGAYLWHALFFAPEDTTAYFTGQAGDPGQDSRRYLRKFRSRLRETEGAVHPDRARGRALGFAAFARAVPVTSDGDALDLPGGPRLWFDAIKSADVPQDADAAMRVASKSSKKAMAEDEFVLKAVTETVDLSGYPQLALPRLMRIAGFFNGRDSVLTPTNVILVGRVSDRYPMALSAIEQIPLENPETLASYLRAVAHLGQLPPNPDTHVLVGNFQGGVELIRILDRAGRVDHGLLETYLEQWSDAHRSASKPEDVAARELDWLVRLLDDLPEAPTGYPGRGRYEQALLASTVGKKDPQSFSWHGLDYIGMRGRSLASMGAAHLEQQQLPGVDQMVEIARELDALEAACEDSNLPVAQQTAATLVDLFRALPNPSFDPPLNGAYLIRQLTPADREQIIEHLTKIRTAKKAKKLSRHASDVEEVRRLMGRELRPLLLEPAYAVGMGEGDNPLFGDPTLVWRHTMVRELEKPKYGDDPWRRTVVVSSRNSTFGSHLAGHVGGVAQALVRLHLGSISKQDEAATQNRARDQFWLDSVATTPWQDITPEVSSTVAAAIALGEATVAHAVSEGVASGSWSSTLTRGVIPLARLEREAVSLASDDGHGPTWVSPAEFLILGLEVANQISDGVEVPVELREVAGVLRTSTVAVGAAWWDQVHPVGSPTPHINGRGRPWIGWLPPYEAIEYEGPQELLAERQLVDLRLRVVEYLGRLALPGEVGSDLLTRAVLDAPVGLHIETLADWEGFLLWLRTLDDGFFDERMRHCFADGLYSAQF